MPRFIRKRRAELGFTAAVVLLAILTGVGVAGVTGGLNLGGDDATSGWSANDAGYDKALLIKADPTIPPVRRVLPQIATKPKPVRRPRRPARRSPRRAAVVPATAAAAPVVPQATPAPTVVATPPPPPPPAAAPVARPAQPARPAPRPAPAQKPPERFDDSG